MSAHLDVELFEFVPAGAGTVLLRLEGRWPAQTRELLPVPALVADDGRRSVRVPPLPGPDSAAPQAGPEPELWRASYPVPAALLDSGPVTFALDAGRGTLVDLPRPAPRGQGRRRSRSSGAELAHERGLRAEAERLADERRRTLRDAEAELDRERAARAAETIRADTAHADLARVRAELESSREHARADAAQRARDADTAADALAIVQARVRELDEALAVQRRRALEERRASSGVRAEFDETLERERTRAAEAVAAQRALAEEATRAQIAAQAQAREHAARVTDLETVRDELRDRLERERDRLRELEAKGAGDLAVEERREVRELQARAVAAERQAAEAERRLETFAQRQELGVVEPGEEALIAELAAQRSKAEESQRQLRGLAGELVEAAHDRTELQRQLAAAQAEADALRTAAAERAEADARLAEEEAVDAERAAAAPGGNEAADVAAAPAEDGAGPLSSPDTAALQAALEAERAARARAEEEARMATEERAELAHRLAQAEASAVAAAQRAETAGVPGERSEDRSPAGPDASPEPEASAASEADVEADGGAVAVFGPFGDAGPSGDEVDGDPEPADRAVRPARVSLWDTDEFDPPTFVQDPESSSAARRAASRAGAGARNGRRENGASRTGERSEPRRGHGPAVTRGAVLLGGVVAVGVLLGLKVAGVLGALTLASL